MAGFEADTRDFDRFAQRLRGIDKTVRKELNQSLLRAAGPAGKFVAVSAGAELPKRGGLGYLIGGAKPGVSVNANAVTLRFRVKNYYLARIDEGTIMHPVFNRRRANGKRVMVAQHVRPGAFRRPFDETAPIVRQEALSALDRVLRDI